jgi:glycosyltransferase involved in cell wall biosynthesis
MNSKSNFILNNSSKILFATFSPWVNGKRLPTNGSVEPLRNFLTERIHKLVLIDQVTPGSDFVIPRIEVFEKNHVMKLMKPSLLILLLQPFLKHRNIPGKTYIFYKIRDFLTVLDWGIKSKDRYDFFIGLESINTIAALVLKKLGIVKKVIYYVSDYSPKRYPDGWFNSIYLWLDRLSASHSDYIWDVSKAIQPARIACGLNPSKSAIVIHVPNGVYPKQIGQEKMKNILPHSLIYMGTLGLENGPDLIISALPVLKKTYTDLQLDIIGGSLADINKLKLLAKKLGVAKHVVFHGVIPNSVTMSKIIRKRSIALATYRNIPGSPRYFGDAGKIRAYCASGLPVITTDVPPLGKEIVDFGAGLMIKDNITDLTKAVNTLFSNKRLFMKMRKKSLEFARTNTWNNEFLKAFTKIDKYEN